MIKTCRILLVDDHDVARRGMRRLLEIGPGLEICGEARTGREALLKAQELKPDIIVMDVIMPDLNGLDATRQIRKLMPHVEVVIISQHESGELMRQTVNAGARACVFKSDSDRALKSAVEAVCQHKTFFSDRASELMKEPVLEQSLQPSLTDREREIIQLLAESKSSKEVAAALNISVKTADTHRANIMRKLNLHSVSDLVRYAIRNNLAQP
jgi:DNA-binding NarL/FixJ family response regulator